MDDGVPSRCSRRSPRDFHRCYFRASGRERARDCSMVFGRKKGFLSSWTSSRSVEPEPDREFKATSYKLEVMHKTLAEIQFNIQVYLASWNAMCQASRAIAVGLAKLAQNSGGVDGRDKAEGREKNKNRVSTLADMAQSYRSAQHTIDRHVRQPTQRVLEETTLRETGTLLSRFPLIFGKIARRKQLLAEVESAKARVRAAEAAKEKEKDSFSAVAGKEHRRRMAAALATTVSAAEGLTAEVMADADRLERERETMLVPQVSALVGCQAYFMRRSAAVLERLAEKLPYSAVAFCRLLRPGALEAAHAPNPSAVAPQMPRHTSSSSTVPVDVSGHSVDSPSRRTAVAASPPPLPLRSNRRDSYDAKKLEQTDRPSSGAATSSPPPPLPPPPPEVGARLCSSSSAAQVTVDAGAEATRSCPAAAASSTAPRWVEPRTGDIGEVAVEEWGATGRDDGVDEEVVW